MSIRYEVPLVAQSKTLICWHASAEMIWTYWQNKTGRMGPMNTIQSNWNTNSRIAIPEFITLAKKVGMKPVHRSNAHYTGHDIEQVLKKHGPLWTAVHIWPHGKPYGHVVVLTGISGQAIHYNDPEHGGSQPTEDVSWFNLHLAKEASDCLMYKDPNAY